MAVNLVTAAVSVRSTAPAKISNFNGTVDPALTVFHTTVVGVDMSTGW